MTAVRMIGEPDATFAWDGERLCADTDLGPGSPPPEFLRGAAATVQAEDAEARWRIVRDPLGLNKLFWAPRSGGIDLAARPAALIGAGHPFGEIAAVSPGVVVDLGPGAAANAPRSLVPEGWFRGFADGLTIEAAGRQIRDRLDRYLAAIAARHREAPVFVCLSGGLDSSGIAALVGEHFPAAVAVSFDLARPGGQASEDRQVAARLAGELGLSLLEATVTADELLEPLDTVLREGIDWRDFNVHAALVNAALAASIAETIEAGQEPALVFTGDLANELLIDYEPERYRGQTYYALPRLEPVALRTQLVRGLDTSHREVGVFAAWKLRLVQPYAVAVDTYMQMPEEFLRLDDRKERLCLAIFGDRIPDYVLERPKARAQIGDATPEGSVLALCVDSGLDAAELRRRFAALHQVDDERSLDRFIRAGRYRARVPSLEEVEA